MNSLPARLETVAKQIQETRALEMIRLTKLVKSILVEENNEAEENKLDKEGSPEKMTLMQGKERSGQFSFLQKCSIFGKKSKPE